MKNYYKIMGLKPSATESEIKSAYRLLAKRYHPDVNPGNSAASEKFADLTEAYGILSDAVKKAEYDRQVGEMMQQRNAQNAQTYNNHYGQFTGAGFQNSQYAQYAQQNQYARQGFSQNAYARAQYAKTQQYAQNFAQQARYAQQKSAQQFAQQQQQIQQLIKKVSEAQRSGYTKGYESGFADAKMRLNLEIEQLRAEAEKAKTVESEQKSEIARLKKVLDDTETDFETIKIQYGEAAEKSGAEIKTLKLKVADLEKDRAGKAKRTASDSAQIKSLKAKISEEEAESEKLKKRIAELERDLSEATGKLLKKETSFTDMKLENARLVSEKKYYEDEFNKARSAVREYENEIELLNRTIAQWEDFSNSLDTAEAMKNLKSQWEKQLRDVKKKLKNTHYGTLGVLYISTDEEIKESFRKIVKRYMKKAETDKQYEAKLTEVNEAFKILSDKTKRKKYNAEIGVSDEEIAEFAENKRKHEEGMERLENEQGEQEFWAYVEELMYNAQIGDAESQNTLGEMYFKGDELEHDPEQAAYWFKEAAKLKYPKALLNLGVCFLTGEGVEKNREKAIGFVKQAAKSGNEAARKLIDADYNVAVLEDEE